MPSVTGGKEGRASQMAAEGWGWPTTTGNGATPVVWRTSSLGEIHSIETQIRRLRWRRHVLRFIPGRPRFPLLAEWGSRAVIGTTNLLRRAHLDVVASTRCPGLLLCVVGIVVEFDR